MQSVANPARYGTFDHIVVRQRPTRSGVRFACKRKSGSRLIAVQCNEESTSHDLPNGTSAVELMGNLARSEGIRFEIAEEEEEEEEDWDDLMDELGDPQSLGTLGLKGITSDESDIPSAYVDEMPLLDDSDIESLRNDGEDVVILDVRSSVEFAAGHREGSINIPINLLRRETFEEILTEQGSVLASENAVVAVVDSGDHRSKQASVRLSRVFGIERVHLYKCSGP